jgi:hypothetical protein
MIAAVQLLANTSIVLTTARSSAAVLTTHIGERSAQVGIRLTQANGKPR